MDLRVDIITLAVPDLDEAHAFYVDRLGWDPALVVPGFEASQSVSVSRAVSARTVALIPESGGATTSSS